MCKSLGGNLLEFENKDEQIDVLTYLIGDKYLRGKGSFCFKYEGCRVFLTFIFKKNN